MSGKLLGASLRSPASRHIAALLILALLALSVVEAIRPVSIPNLRPTASFGFTEYFSSTANPINITQGPDGRIYYVGSDTTIDATNLDGTGSFEYSIPSPCPAHDLTSGPDAAIWFTEPGCNRIGRMTPAGIFTEYPMPDLLHGVPWDIVQGADLNLWFTLSNRSCGTGMDCSLTAIARIKPADGSISIFVAPSRFGFPSEIALGTDGNIWFAEPGASSLGRALPDGTITDFPGTGGASQVAAGADGRLWFSGGSGNAYGVMTLTGAVTMYSYPIAVGGSYSTQDLIGPAPDGNVWFSAVKQDVTTVTSVAVLGNISPLGVVQDFPLPPAPNPCCARLPAGLALDTLNRVWYTDTTQTYIGHTDPLVSSISPTPTPPSQVAGGSPSTPPASKCQNIGHPVNCATGELWHRIVDLSIPGHGLGLSLTQTYSSMRAAQDGPLGFAWTHSYNMALTFMGDGSVNVLEEGGSVITFIPNGSGGYAGPSWVFATFAKNGDGSYTFRRKDQTSFTFSAAGQLTKEQDRNGYATTMSYAGGELVSVTDSSQRQLQLQYSGSHLVKAIDPIQRAVSFGYDASGNLTSITDVGGAVTRMTYDTNHLLLTMTDPNGGVVKNQYDASNRVSSQTDAMGRTATWSYTTGTTTVIDPRGNATKQTYQSGRLVSLTQAFGTAQAATWTMTYDQTNFGLTSVTDPNGHVTEYRLDPLSNVLSTTDPLGRTWSFTYDGSNNLTSATDPLGATTRLTYDTYGNLTSVAKPLDSTSLVGVTLTYDPSHPGDVVSAKDPNGNSWQYLRDQYGDITRATDPIGNSSTYTFDQAGRVIKTVSARGNAPGSNPADFRTTYSYDAYNDVVEMVDPLGNKTDRQYDGNGNLTGITDPNGHVTKIAFDLNNEPLAGTRADGAQVQNVYDAGGNLIQQIDALGHTTTYAYDALNQLAATTDPLGRVTRRVYDAGGNVIATTDPAGQTTSYAYDAANELTAITYSDGKTPSASFAYDKDGRRIGMADGTGSTSYSYDAIGRLTQSVSGSGAKVAYAYDLNGNLLKLTYPDGSQVVRTYDTASRLGTVTDWLGHQTKFAYDQDGNLTAQTYPNRTTATFSYDTAGRLTQITDSGPMGQISFMEGRDSVGQLTSERVAGEPPYGPVNYAYDPANRLASANYGGLQLSYQYDAADRLTQITHSLGNQSLVSALTYDNAGQLLSLTTSWNSMQLRKLQFSYDANGNRTQSTDQAGNSTSYGFDQANRLTAYGGKATYAYNGDGLRMSKTVGTAAEAFTGVCSGQLPLLIQDGATRYVTGSGGAPLEQIASDGTVRYYHQDALGSTRALTNASGHLDSIYLYDAYGNTIAFTGSRTPNPFQFAGAYTDAESGLQYLQSRYYDPSTAQFLSRDPIEPVTRQPYAYAANNPLNMTDPSGAWPNINLGGILHTANSFLSKASVVLGVASVACDLVTVVTLGGAGPVCAVVNAVAMGAAILTLLTDIPLYFMHDPSITGLKILVDVIGLVPGLAGLKLGKAAEETLVGVAPALRALLQMLKAGKIGPRTLAIAREVIAYAATGRKLALAALTADLAGLGISLIPTEPSPSC
jgi:RHS repeat-associated protein